MEKTKMEVQPLTEASGTVRTTSGWGRQFIAAAVVSLLPFMYGMTIGWPSPVQPLLESDRSPLGRLNYEETSWLASLTYLGGVVGPLFWSKLADARGRKVGGCLVSSAFLVGWGLTAFTSHRYLLFLARFVNGFGGSGSMIVAATYTSEIAQDSIRGTLGSFVMLTLNGGVLFTYTLGAMLSYEYLNFACVAVPLLYFSMFIWMPESPEYLWTKNRVQGALDSLMWLRRGDSKCVREEMSRFNKNGQQKAVHYGALVATKGRRRSMMTGFILFSLQQLCGLVPILSYTSVIFQLSGNSSGSDIIIVGIIQLLASVVSSSIIDCYGRKVLLFTSYAFMGLALTTFGIYFNIGTVNFGWIPLLCLSIHVLNYSLGAGTVPYIVLSETLPIDIKGLAISVCILWGTLLAFINVKIFPLLIVTFGLGGCLWIYALFCFSGLIFTWFYVPETKGIPLQDIILRLDSRKEEEV